MSAKETSHVSAPPRCTECGEPITAEAPAGLCPRCLLQVGLNPSGAEELVSGTTAPRPTNERMILPSLAELQAYFPYLELLELIGQGGMGAVYKARQASLDRFVAVKILPPRLSHIPGFTQRFLREARALARLGHPNIIAVHDVGEANGLCYFVMEYVEGVNLRAALQSGRIQPAETLSIVIQLCEALQYAHDSGVVHRDIKPENILLDRRGRVKIADFGLAKLIGQEPESPALTSAEHIMGTPRYMAPEQVQGSQHVDHRADIFSLGVVFYELLTGELPMGRFAPPSQKVHLDARLDEVVLRTLEKEPQRRYQHASEIKTAIEATTTPLLVPTPSPSPPFEMSSKIDWPRRTVSLMAGTVSAATCTVGTAMCVHALQWSTATREQFWSWLGIGLVCVIVGGTVAGLAFREFRQLSHAARQLDGAPHEPSGEL